MEWLGSHSIPVGSHSFLWHQTVCTRSSHLPCMLAIAGVPHLLIVARVNVSVALNSLFVALIDSESVAIASFCGNCWHRQSVSIASPKNQSPENVSSEGAPDTPMAIASCRLTWHGGKFHDMVILLNYNQQREPISLSESNERQAVKRFCADSSPHAVVLLQVGGSPWHSKFMIRELVPEVTSHEKSTAHVHVHVFTLCVQ